MARQLCRDSVEVGRGPFDLLSQGAVQLRTSYRAAKSSNTSRTRAWGKQTRPSLAGPTSSRACTASSIRASTCVSGSPETAQISVTSA
jgi:hypothetical protein